MKLDVRKWADTHSDIRWESLAYVTDNWGSVSQFAEEVQSKPFLDASGYLTDFAKDIMKNVYKVNTLDDLLTAIEGSGKGYWYKSDLGRPDVNIRGHNAETLWGNTFRYNQGGQGSDYSN